MAIKISGAAALLALAALLATGARAYSSVTTAECKERRPTLRQRQYPTDTAATELAMAECSLNQIDPAALTGIPNVFKIELDSNNIESINPAVFRNVPALTMLWLTRNKLRELPVFDERSCPNLTELLLSNNKLTQIDKPGTFSACSKLQHLDITYNYIEFIHPDSFSGLTSLKKLYLNHNKIRFVPDQLFLQTNKLMLLTLNNNRISHLPRNFASSVKHTGASLEYFYFNFNPWHCACLIELLMDVKRAGVRNYKNWDGIQHYGGALPACNYIGMYPCRRDAPSGLRQLAPRAAQGGR